MVHFHFAVTSAVNGNNARINSELLKRAVVETLQSSKTGHEADLSIVITDDPGIQKLNFEFRKINRPTDVLAFPSDEVDPDTGRRYLGDVILSIQRAQAQAEAGNHTLEDELQLLVVHGVLHLVGYDHGEESEKARMDSLQNSILTRLGCQAGLPGS
ncbi:MAG: rRNA maturation RNase YbeY [Anaerolineales bacterium]